MYKKTYKEKSLTHISYPLGGIGTGMLCLSGNGSLSSVSVRNEPNLFYNPIIFSAIHIKGKALNTARVLEGQVPYQRIFGIPGDTYLSVANGAQDTCYGLPRFTDCTFTAQFPFAKLELLDNSVPVEVNISAFSPFIPGDSHNSSLPAASLTYSFHNTSSESLSLTYFFSALNFMKVGEQDKGVCGAERVFPKSNGFILHQPPLDENAAAEGSFYFSIHDEQCTVNTDWFDGGWFDILTMQWNDIKSGTVRNGHNLQNVSPGGSIALTFELPANAEKSITLQLGWYVPKTNQRYGYEDDKADAKKDTYAPYYAGVFSSVEEVMAYYEENYASLRSKSIAFSDGLAAFQLSDEDSLSAQVSNAISSTLTVLKSPTVLRQKDGRLWAWEGTFDKVGSCYGSCTHVWNYQQALCHLFPDLERTLRYTEFHENQDDSGHQEFRTSLPIRKSGNRYHAASDGQLGGIMKMYREWRISGDTTWLRDYWHLIEKSMEYCIEKWDPKHEGVLKEPHHNTYDIEFWGADGMCSSFYLGALKAACLMGRELDKEISLYETLYQKGREYMENQLFNGEYFYQQTEWETLSATLDLSKENPNCVELLQAEGPKYQYGTGCISDGVLGVWMAQMCGIEDILDDEKVKSHLLAVYRHNFKKTLIAHDNPQRPGFALGKEGGLLLCTWPHGGKPSLPFVYSDEVWTGIEYQVASHLISYGYHAEGLEIITAVRERYNGEKRNPFSECECGYWYARAMASYGLLYACTGVRYDAPTKTLYANKGKYQTFFAAQSAFGTVICNGEMAEFTPVYGQLEILHTVMC